MASSEDPNPFDETAVTRGRHKCFFCESDKSDEWRFLARLNAFICKACRERLDKVDSEELKSG